MIPRDPFDSMPSSPVHSPQNLGNALLQIARGRRGRTLIISAVFAVVLLGLLVQSSSESLSYKSISNYQIPSWRTKGPDRPEDSNEESPLLTPSNITLEIESGNITNVPSHLKKGTPNFHLLMPATHENPDFCKTVLSAMLLNYPPPTILNFDKTLETVVDIEMAKLQAIHNYLQDAKHVKENDIVLIVDGYDVWFQLPSDVIIKQYQNIITDANERLRERYGLTGPSSTGGPAKSRYNQTVVWGAEKVCSPEQQDEPACVSIPESTLPRTIYGKKTDQSANLTRARYLNAGTVIGPAGDLRAIFKAAIVKTEDPASFSELTAQSLLSAVFGEQEFAREVTRQKTLSAGSAWRNWLANKLGRPKTNPETPSLNITLIPGHRYEFSMGLDYTHSLFQPLTTTAPSELILFSHNNSTDLTKHHHANTPTPPLSLPHALLAAAPPFSSPNPISSATPNTLSAHIVPLQLNPRLDKLPPSNTSWEALPLLTNVYTGAVPALLHLNIAPPLPPGPKEPRTWDNPIELNAPPDATTRSSSALPTPTPISPSPSTVPPFPNLPAGPNSTYPSWQEMWFHPYARALLRRYLRMPEGPIAAHAAAVGGDAWWDMRGGRGGIWTERAEWLGWGEEDGVCGTREKVQEVFGDAKGMWLKEGEEEDGEEAKEEKEEVEEEQKEEQKEEEKQEEEKPEDKQIEEWEKLKGDEQKEEQHEEQHEEQNSEPQNNDSENDSTFNADFHPFTATPTSLQAQPTLAPYANSTSHLHSADQTPPSKEEIRKQEEEDRKKDEKNPISL